MPSKRESVIESSPSQYLGLTQNKFGFIVMKVALVLIFVFITINIKDTFVKTYLIIASLLISLFIFFSASVKVSKNLRKELDEVSLTYNNRFEVLFTWFVFIYILLYFIYITFPEWF